jgi:hypothetical protein
MALPKVIPPQTVVELIRADAATPLWCDQIGRRFRVGYYSKMDGLDTIWLVSPDGDFQTTDRKSFGRYFEIVEASNERGLYAPSKSYFRTNDARRQRKSSVQRSTARA